MTDTTQSDALRALIEKVKAGGDCYGFEAVGGALLRGYADDAYRGCLNSAKALHEALLSKRYDLSGLHKFGETWGVRIIPGHHIARNDNPARAWLLAILRAKLAEVEA